MGLTGYTWDDEKAAANERKHGVDFDTAAEVFLDPGRLEWRDGAHSQKEDRWRTIGTGGQDVLFVVFTEWVDNVIRIISARKATRNERRLYHKVNS